MELGLTRRTDRRCRVTWDQSGRYDEQALTRASVRQRPRSAPPRHRPGVAPPRTSDFSETRGTSPILPTAASGPGALRITAGPWRGRHTGRPPAVPPPAMSRAPPPVARVRVDHRPVPAPPLGGLALVGDPHPSGPASRHTGRRRAGRD